MIHAEEGTVRIEGHHLQALYVLLRRHEEDLTPRLAELQAAVERVLFESLSIDEIERLNDIPDD